MEAIDFSAVSQYLDRIDKSIARFTNPGIDRYVADIEGVIENKWSEGQ